MFQSQMQKHETHSDKMHNDLEKQAIVQRDAMYFKLSLDMSLDWVAIAPFYSKSVIQDLHEMNVPEERSKS